MTKKILAILLAFILLFQAIPTQAFATGGVEEPNPEGGEIIIPDGEVEGEAPLLAAENPGENSRARNPEGKPLDVNEQVYVAIYDGDKFPGEPAWYSEANYTFIRKSGSNLSASFGNYSSRANSVVDDEILENMTEGSSNDNDVTVWGYYNAAGTNGYILDETLTSAEGQKRIIELIRGRGNADGYKIIWYVIKYQSDTQWHIDGLIVKNNTYYVNYYGNGNTGGGAPNGARNLEAGYKYTVKGNEGNLVKTGYTFAGWNTQADGQGMHYNPGAEIIISGNVSLYAQWAPNTTSITVKKDWDDGNNQDGLRPDSVTVHLLANGKHDQSRRVTLNAGNNWSASWENLPAVDGNGRTIAYTVEEEAVSGYSSNITGSVNAGFEITNTHTPATTSVQAQKVWADDHDRDGMRPDSVELQLYKQVGNAAAVAYGNPVEVSDGTSWTAQWRILPKYEGGTQIKYSVKEVGIPEGYTASYSVDEYTGHLIVKNTYTPQKTSITVNKIWDDARNQDGKRPDSVTVNLKAGEEAVKTLTLNANNNWKATVNDLPVYAEGEKIVYTVEETNVPEGYTPNVDGFTITNSYTPATVSIPVEKVWQDAENQDGKRPENVKVTLLANGASTGKTVTLSEANEWKASFEGLAKYSAGNAIAYSIAEHTVAGYSSAITGSAAEGYTITNTHTPATTEVNIIKVWDDANNQDGIRPASVTVAVYNGDEKVAETTVSASHNWKATVTGLPKYAGGVEIQYTVKEAAVQGYNLNDAGEAQPLTAQVANGNVTITNTHTPATTQVTVTKVWTGDEENASNNRHEVVIHLLADGVHMNDLYNDKDYSKKLNEENSWKYEWTNLPEYTKGHKIQYSVVEEDVENSQYTASYTHQEGAPNNITITNTYAPDMTSVHVEKIWDDADNQDHKRPDSITVKLLKMNAEGKQETVTGQEIVLSAANGWEGVFTNLPKYVNQNEEIQYYVEEVTVDGYESKVTEDAHISNSFIITNSYTPETTSVSVTKEWEDNNNQDGKRPANVTVTLHADGEATDKTLTLNETNGWEGTFTDLPVNNAGNKIIYTVEEDKVENYTAAITGDAANGFTITNTHIPEVTELTVTKKWDDADNQDGIRPDSVEVTLLADDVAVGEPVVLTAGADGKWSYTFKNLDKYKAGQEIEYTVEEEFVTGYASVITGDAANGFTITNTHTPEVIDIPVTKVWEDKNDQDGIRPDHLNVTLLANGEEIDQLTLSADNNWSGVFENLPKNASGQLIIYTVAEKEVPDGYTVSGPATADNNYTITNTHAVEKTTMTVIKVWDDDNNRDNKRPQSVTFHLLADGEHTEKKAVLTDEDNWSYTWSGLDKYAAGKPIRYTVYEENLSDREDLADIYDVDYKYDPPKVTVTNSYTPETTTVTAVKIWDDGDNRDMLRPDSVTVALLSNGSEVKTEVLNEDNGWAYTWTDLPKNENGHEIAYTVKETEVPTGYTSAVEKDEYDPEEDVEDDAQVHANVITNEFIITNTHEPETTEVTVTKVWDDADNQDGIRPDSIRVTLYKDGVPVTAAELNADNNWTYTFSNLYKFQNGEIIAYTVAEADVDVPAGYQAQAPVIDNDGVITLTNTHTPATTSVTVTKIWDDEKNQDGKRPDSIIVKLFAGGEDTGKTVTLSEANDWSATINNLPVNKAGKVMKYSVEESTVDNYDAPVYETVVGEDGITITVTNTHEPELIDIPVTKVWVDNDDQDGFRPDSIIVKLFAGGEDTGKTVTLSGDGNSWEGKFTDLDKYADGVEIEYSIEEAEVTEGDLEEYTSTIEGFTITNTHIPEVTELTVTKEWDDADNQDGIRPESITVTLYADGKETNKMLNLAADGEWSGTFTELPKYAGGEEIEYTVSENAVTGYTPSITGTMEDGFLITNTHEVAKTTVTATKVWNDNDNQDGKRPAEVTIHLLADNQDTGEKVVLNESNKWTYTWTGLDANAAGKAILYTVAEEALKDIGYSVSYSTDTEAPFEITVTNAYTPEEISVRVLKVWDDGHNQDGIRPATVTLQLYKTVNDVKTAVGEPVNVSSEYQWSKLPKFENGKAITYSVEEKNVPEGYSVSYTTDAAGDLIVKNTHIPETIDKIAVAKIWVDADNQDGIRPESVTVALHANGEEVAKLTLNEANKWSGEFKNLPKFANGKEIKYTVKEPTVPEGYKVTVDGFTITNTHVPATTEVTVTKVWNDAHNQDGIRPDSITAEIYADGKVVKTVELTAETNWKATVSDLPKNADGKPIAYTVKEKNVPAGYTASVDGFTITNTHAVAKTEVSVKKLWVDENNQDGKRPAAVTVGLYADGVFTGKTLILSAANGWNAEFQDLDKFHQGKVIIYTVLENVVVDYAPVYNYSVDAKDGTTHATITNIHAIDLVSIPVQKIWNDADDQDGKRPDSITVTLYADGRTTGKTLTLNAENLWTDTFVGLPKNNDGKLIEYSVLENTVDDYTADIKSVNGKFIITNTHEVEKTELTAVKVWKDADDQDGKRPDEIVLHLLANGVCVDKATLNADGKWTYTWSNLDKYATGQEITYSVHEEPVADENGKQIYTVSYKQDSATKITVTNTYSPETTAVQMQKVWEDGHDRDGLRPESITVTLLGNGKKVASAVLNEANGWIGSWTNLPKFQQGKQIQYTVAEDEVPDGYESAVALREDGQFIITNTHAPATTGVTVEKIWADENDNDGKRPDGIIVQLYANGSAVETGKVVLDEKNGWAYAWESTEELPLYVFDHGELIHYYVQETGYIIDGVEYEGLPEGYVGSTATGENAYAVSITNTRASEKIAVSVVKAWADQDNNDGIRPESVEMTLMKNGAAVETVTLNADNNWTYTWKDLYKYAKGELVKYTVQEAAVDGYEAAYSTAEGDEQITITVTNTHVAETKEVTVTKVWKDNNDEEELRPDSVTVQLYKNGEAYGDPIKLSAANSWSYAAVLNVYEGGKEIAWSVKEIGIPRYYTVSYDQNTLTITNTIQSKDVPKSGDFNNLWMWFVLMGGCTAGAVSVVLGGKKKGKYAR